ncbi:hypothetical protein DVH26_22840 [Paenibacillus sp. H1-7]|nr:hypothetical protein DVH26_22840 [Paenibacillus sp. H1-7]
MKSLTLMRLMMLLLTEFTTERGGAHTDFLLEEIGEIMGVGITQLLGNFVDRQVGLDQHQLGRFHFFGKNIVVYRGSHFLLEHPVQMLGG